jgi:hypothetical protein
MTPVAGAETGRGQRCDSFAGQRYDGGGAISEVAYERRGNETEAARKPLNPRRARQLGHIFWKYNAKLEEMTQMSKMMKYCISAVIMMVIGNRLSILKYEINACINK